MAKIVEDIIIVKLSKLVRDEDDSGLHLVDNVLRARIEEAAQNVAPSDVVVEIEKK
jgi:hypothetical protein